MNKNSSFVPGDVVYDGQYYHFLVAKRDSYSADRGEFYRTNCTVNVYHPVKHFTNGNQDGYTRQLIISNQIAIFEDVSGKMQMFDAGLLQTTTRRFLLPNTIDIKYLDCIEFRNEKMQVDNINNSDYDPFLYIQCSPDKRKYV